MKVLAVIVAYNGMKWYDRCFKSLKQSEIPLDIMVIDNASTDNTINYIKQNYPSIKLFESNENLGFAKANNIGLKYALENKIDYVFLLNQDAWINQTNTISELVRISEENPDFAILSPLQLYGNGKKIEHEVLMYFARNAQLDDDLISDLYFGNIKNIYSVPYACAASWLIPLKTIQTVGGFDPVFYHYGEDDNYIQRIFYIKKKIGICPRVNFSHDIELRPQSHREKYQDWKKYLLLRFCNVNYPLNIQKVQLKNIKIIIIQILRLNFKLLKSSIPEFIYILKIKKDVKLSRKENIKQQANWLEIEA